MTRREGLLAALVGALLITIFLTLGRIDQLFDELAVHRSGVPVCVEYLHDGRV